MNKLIPALFLLLSAACGTASRQAPATLKADAPPPAGAIVAADSIAYTDDPLNHYFFAVKLRVSAANTSAGDAGMRYDILAGYGPAQAEGALAMPRGAGALKPLLRRDTAEKYGFIIGFIAGKEYGGDGAFSPYYSVSATRGEIRMRQLRAYEFSGR